MNTLTCIQQLFAESVKLELEILLCYVREPNMLLTSCYLVITTSVPEEQSILLRYTIQAVPNLPHGHEPIKFE